MAKKKSAATSSPVPAKTAKPTPMKKIAASKASSNGDGSTAAAVLGHDQIGITAGAIWMYLTDNGETSLATLKKEVKAPGDLVLAAVGWLAREDKLDFAVNGKTVKVSLK